MFFHRVKGFNKFKPISLTETLSNKSGLVSINYIIWIFHNAKYPRATNVMSLMGGGG